MIVTANTLSELARKAARACEASSQSNLILQGTFPYEEINSAFIQAHSDVALEWQSATKPGNLFINHGEYIFRHGDGWAFLTEELKKKRDSRRAILSLIDMKDLIRSGDDPIPSFTSLQFGFPDRTSTDLIVTAYFRALEVSAFLPQNLAEISLRVGDLKKHFPDIETFSLTVLAFTAYVQKGFHCLRKAELDNASPAQIAIAVHSLESDTLRSWLDSKLTIEESAVCIDGLATLVDAVRICSDLYNAEFLHNLEEALVLMVSLREGRKRTSDYQKLSHIAEAINDHLESAKELLP